MNDESNNEVTQVKNNAPTDTSNPFEEIAKDAPRRIVGQLMKFSKGDYLYGKDNDEIPIGTRMIANMDQLLVGWIKWQDSKPVEQVMGLVVEGFKPMKANELPDRDETEWETDDKGKPRDPWQKTFYLLMKELDADGKPLEGDDGLYTFTTSSVGGKDAISELCARYGKWMRTYPGKFPIITLQKDKYQHPDRQLGIIKTPKFEFNHKKDWIAKEEFGNIDGGPDESEGEEVPF